MENDTSTTIFDYLLKNHPDKINIFKMHPNLHIRYLFMEYIITEQEDLLPIMYENILDYITSVTNTKNEQLTLIPELMNIKDISNLYYLLFKSKHKDLYCSSLKEYILNNYPNNDIAYNLLMDFSDRQNESISAFKEDADILFQTSRNFKFHIFNHYSALVSEEIMNDFKKHLRGFRPNETSYIERVFIYELGEKFTQYIDKYLSLSTNDDIRFLGAGTTCASYKIGDWCLKLIKSKWSYEDVICPDLYLIAKNYEEDYIRNSNGRIAAGLEVQQYFKRSASAVPNYILELYTRELEKLGYYTTDTLINGSYGDNCRLLDSYNQAHCKNPELLPNWFKDYPLVLVDRDCVYQNGTKKNKTTSCKPLEIQKLSLIRYS